MLLICCVIAPFCIRNNNGSFRVDELALENSSCGIHPDDNLENNNNDDKQKHIEIAFLLC